MADSPVVRKGKFNQ